MVLAEPILLSQIVEFARHLIAVRSWEMATVLATTLGALTVLNLAAPRLGLVDHPDGGRKRHTRPVPMTGGLAIMTGVAIGATFSLSMAGAPVEVLALLGVVAVIHAVDDQSGNTGEHGLSARQRLSIDTALALAFILVTGSVIESFGTVGNLTMGLGPLAVPFTVLIYLAVTNAYNMIDGLDGLALSQFLIAFVAVGLWNPGTLPAEGLAPPALPIILACGVVLAANVGIFGRFFRCFLGDSGARLLGFFLVYILIADGGRMFAPPGALFFIAVPLLDLCAVVGERVRAGEGPMAADRRHLHHLLTDAGLGPARVVAMMAALSVGFIAGLLALQTLGAGDLTLMGAFVALAVLYWMARRRFARLTGQWLASPPMMGPAE